MCPSYFLLFKRKFSDGKRGSESSASLLLSTSLQVGVEHQDRSVSSPAFGRSTDFPSSSFHLGHTENRKTGPFFQESFQLGAHCKKKKKGKKGDGGGGGMAHQRYTHITVVKDSTVDWYLVDPDNPGFK